MELKTTYKCIQMCCINFSEIACPCIHLEGWNILNNVKSWCGTLWSVQATQGRCTLSQSSLNEFSSCPSQSCSWVLAGKSRNGSSHFSPTAALKLFLKLSCQLEQLEEGKGDPRPQLTPVTPSWSCAVPSLGLSGPTQSCARWLLQRHRCSWPRASVALAQSRAWVASQAI